MKYETPELSLLPHAVYSIQGNSIGKPFGSLMESTTDTELISAYEDWE
jgi:hypothetical protein